MVENDLPPVDSSLKARRTAMATNKLYDVLIIGGGPACLSVGLSLARQVYSAIIPDSGIYRNARSQHMHTLPGFDHEDPAVFRSKVRTELSDRY